jgi:hypothetical protein
MIIKSHHLLDISVPKCILLFSSTFYFSYFVDPLKFYCTEGEKMAEKCKLKKNLIANRA